MKKVLAITLVLILALTVFAACGNNDPAPPPVTGNGDENGADPGPVTPEFTIRFAHIENEFTAAAQGVRVFERLVNEYSNGRIQVVVHGAGALGDEREILEAVIMNQLEGGMVMSSLFSAYLPNWDICDFPFAFRDRDDWAAKIDGEMGQILKEETLSIGIRVVNFFDGGFRSIANNRGPLNSMADFGGLITRVGQSPLLLETHRALGTSPVPMAFGEIYTALQLGTIDAVETAVIYIVDGNFQEVTDYVTLTHTTALQMVTFVSLDFYNSLPADLQEAIDRAAARTVIEQRQLAIEADEMAFEAIRAAGVEIQVPSDAFMQEMMEATRSVVEDFRDRVDPRLLELAGF